ncbi:MAG TPA: hypothetical protein VEC17_00735 [Candidatus Binatia bacterium]|nr:hypothetical protein [Candidatus Binatia bacterium]
MNDLINTKKKMRQAIKKHLLALKVPGEIPQSKKATVKWGGYVTLKLTSNDDVHIGCAEVKRGRRPGYYAIYWIIIISGNSFTSHKFSPSHYDVGPNSDFDVIAEAVCKDIKKYSFPIIKRFLNEKTRG